MFEKVNPSHPDKLADRIAGALVDFAYQREENPRIAVEVLIGHGHAYVIAESSVIFTYDDVQSIIDRICGTGTIHTLRLLNVQQDQHLADNQKDGLRCGDNGIFKGVPVSDEERYLLRRVKNMYKAVPNDGKYIIRAGSIIACQSNIDTSTNKFIHHGVFKDGTPYIGETTFSAFLGGNYIINPLGDWTGGLDVDSGATNRKLGSDMGRAVTGGGLHGKDLSKADVSVNIVCHILAQQFGCDVEASCAIGDEEVEFIIIKEKENRDFLTLSYPIIVAMAREYITKRGGFEKFAEWGLVDVSD